MCFLWERKRISILLQVFGKGRCQTEEEEEGEEEERPAHERRKDGVRGVWRERERQSGLRTEPEI